METKIKNNKYIKPVCKRYNTKKKKRKETRKKKNHKLPASP